MWRFLLANSGFLAQWIPGLVLAFNTPRFLDHCLDPLEELGSYALRGLQEDVRGDEFSVLIVNNTKAKADLSITPCRLQMRHT